MDEHQFESQPDPVETQKKSVEGQAANSAHVGEQVLEQDGVGH